MPEAGQFLVDSKDANVNDADVDATITMIDDNIGQSFQRIQRNRQSRIRVKMCRKAGKRADEVVIIVTYILVFIVMVKVLEEEMLSTIQVTNRPKDLYLQALQFFQIGIYSTLEVVG